jgi:hypothetical protein
LRRTFEAVAAERAEAVAKALVLKEEIAAKAEALIKLTQEPSIGRNQLKEMTDLFESWQKLQKEGPKVPKNSN